MTRSLRLDLCFCFSPRLWVSYSDVTGACQRVSHVPLSTESRICHREPELREMLISISSRLQHDQGFASRASWTEGHGRHGVLDARQVWRSSWMREQRARLSLRLGKAAMLMLEGCVLRPGCRSSWLIPKSLRSNYAPWFRRFTAMRAND